VVRIRVKGFEGSSLNKNDHGNKKDILTFSYFRDKIFFFDLAGFDFKCQIDLSISVE